MPRLAPLFVGFALAISSCSSPDEKNNVAPGDDMGGANNITADMTTTLDVNNGLTPDQDSMTGCATQGCPQTQVCNMQTGVCVDCLTNAECGAEGVCDPTSNKCRCNDGFHPCNGVCSANDSVDTCGNGCMPCPTDANGTATCNGIQCGLACDAGYSLNTAGDMCSQCEGANDCRSPSASVCSGNACEPCTDNAGCSHLGGTPMCDNGTCVECSATNDTACAGNSCDPTTGTCTTTPKESVAACSTCIADSECMVGFGCIEMEFDGNARTDRFCLPERSGACPAVYTIPVTRPNAAGQSGVYCTIAETVQTCEALADYNSACADPSDCGNPALNDGLCEPIDFDVARCTVRCAEGGACADATECGPGEICHVDGYCVGPSQCPSASLIGCATGATDVKWCGAY